MKQLETIVTFILRVAGFIFTAKWKRRDSCPYRDCPWKPPEEE